MNYKVIFIAPWAPPYGGISSSLKDLVPSLKKLGCDVAVFSPYGQGQEEIQCEGIPIFRFSIRYLLTAKPHVSFISLLKFIQHFSFLSWRPYVISAITSGFIYSKLKGNNKSLIFCTYGTDKLYLAPFLKLHPNTMAVVSTIYAGLILYPERFKNHEDYIKYCLLASDRILSCSNYCASLALQVLGIKTPYSYIYNSVDHYLYRPGRDSERIRKKLNIPATATVLLFLSRMNRDMGTDFVISNVLNWLASIPNLYVIIAGAYDELGAQVSTLASKSNRIKISYDIAYEEKPYYYSAADIFSAPTKLNHPCLGVSNIEAMMSGIAVLSSDTGGHREVLEHSKSGVLVPFDGARLDQDAYFESLKELVGNIHLRQMMGNEARKYAVSNFTNGAIAKCHLELFNSLWNSRLSE